MTMSLLLHHCLLRHELHYARSIKENQQSFSTKPLHAKWFVDLYNTLKDEKEMVKNGFRSAGITDAIENAKDMVEKVENPFKEV